MKKLTCITVLMLTVLLSCKKEPENLTVLKGDFVYHDGAAILQTDSEIYGVLITDKTEELNTKAKKHKNEPTDMVQVEVKGKIVNKKDDKILWENKVEIVEILDVKPAPKEENNVIKLGNQ